MSALSLKWAIPLDQHWSVITVRARDKCPALRHWKEYQSKPATRETVAKWASGDALKRTERAPQRPQGASSAEQGEASND